jgi:ADP-heptose:LPS heptosyltransferase
MSLSKKIKASLIKAYAKKSSKNFDLKDTKSVLVLKYDRIGDMIIATPIFRELKKINPDIKVGVLASKINKDIIKYNKSVDEVYEYSDELLKDYTLLNRLKNMYDVVIDLDHSFLYKSLYLVKKLNPKAVISIYKNERYNLDMNRLEIYDYTTKNNLNKHFRDLWLETLEFFEPKDKLDNRYEIALPDSTKAKDFISKDKYIIGINLEGSNVNRSITKEKLYYLLDNLKSLDDIEVVILHTPNKHQYVKDILNEFEFDFVKPSFVTESILDVALLIKECSLVITPDTSIVHIASSFDIPLVSIYENNQRSYNLFYPTSTLSHTIFAKESVGTQDYDLDEILEYSFRLLAKIKK